MADNYDHKKIEAKWQAEWEKSGLYRASDQSEKPKYYALVEFPYPSGDGLHVGHPRPYIGMDIIARKRRMEGYNVLYPMGWDAFGLPTENYAIKTGIHPAVVTKQNSDNFHRQIKMLGASFDWSREINTTDPQYYKWTQWIFLQLYKNNLAYKAKTEINWCPSCKIGLANEEVIQEKCERCGTKVEQREKEQWLLAITKYADRLEKDLKQVNYPESVKTQQRNWLKNLHDWIFSRQRYWGEPIPMIRCEKCGWQPVAESDLPVVLPEVENYQPREDGESPLASVTEWVNVKCPKCGGVAQRETDVMPNWAGSSWYYLRYLDPDNNKVLADSEKLKHWLPVDWYNGGMEHTTLHLLYSRFWHKFLFDIGVVTTSEPYKKRTSHGLILAAGGAKMSKSKGNVVNPDQIVELYGADTLRLYEMFMGPFEQAVAWSDESIIGSRRFIERIWKFAHDKISADESNISPELQSALEKTIKKVSNDIEKMAFNTAVSQMMIMVNLFKKEATIPKKIWRDFLIILAPFIPHLTEELWHNLGEESSVHLATWPISLDNKSSLE